MSLHLIYTGFAFLVFFASSIILYGMIWVGKKDFEMGVNRNIFTIPFSSMILAGQFICAIDTVPGIGKCILTFSLLISQSFFFKLWVKNSPFMNKRKEALETMKLLTLQMLQDTSSVTNNPPTSELLNQMIPLGEIDEKDLLKQAKKVLEDSKKILADDQKTFQALYSNNALYISNRKEN